MKRDIKKMVKRVIKEHKRALVGFAHYDKGEKVKGCNCCYCKPDRED
jgi:hypothetical protein